MAGRSSGPPLPPKSPVRLPIPQPPKPQAIKKQEQHEQSPDGATNPVSSRLNSGAFSPTEKQHYSPKSLTMKRPIPQYGSQCSTAVTQHKNPSPLPSPELQVCCTEDDIQKFRISLDVRGKSATDNQPRSMERDYDFVERPSQDFFCPVSLELLLEPQQLSCCGNHLSREAATRLQREGKACPMCNATNWTAVLDKYHYRKVRDLHVYCTHKAKGCDWSGELSNLEQHAGACQKRPWVCRYCKLQYAFEEKERKHWPTCHKFPEPCPNGCEVGSVERCTVEQHRSVCSLEPVACEMKEFGCSAVVPRKELATHMRESELQHLTAMAVLNFRENRRFQQKIMEFYSRVGDEVVSTPPNSSTLPLHKEGQAWIKKNTVIIGDYSKHKGTDTIYTCLQSYTHSQGYTFRFMIRYQENSETNKGISALIGVVKGDNDDKLNWPMTIEGTVELINMAGDNNHVKKTRIFEWYKEDRERLKQFGHQLISYADLEKQEGNIQYLMDDSLRFKIHLIVRES